MVVNGKKLTVRGYLQKVRSEFVGLTPRQKWEHFWEYYKGILVMLAVVIFIIAVIVGAINTLNTEVRLSGTLINVEVSPDGYVYLQDGYFERIGAQKGEEVVDLYNMQFADPFTTLDQTYALNVQENVVAMISDEELDYLMFDELALPFFLSPDNVMDLRELFTQQELDAMGMALIKLQIPETGELIPVAIDIRDTVFFREYIATDDPIYLAFSIKTPRKEACLDFWYFIKGGSTAGFQTRLAGTVIDAPVSDEGSKRLSEGFFEAQGYVPGDDRVELTKQSFIQPEGEEADAAQMVIDNVRTMLAEGTLDYFVVDEAALQTLADVQFLDLRQVLTEDQLAQLADAVVYRDEVPVAVELSATAFAPYCTGKAYLAFNEATNRVETCKALWAYLNS